ncbi:MAG: hypothetical protein ABII02_02170 [Candidatus Magasanikbacteria bacterium]
MNQFTPRQLNMEELKELESVFWNAYSDRAIRDEIWEELDTFFATKNSIQDKDHHWSFFRWYVQLAWHRTSMIIPIQMMNIMGRQSYMALALGTDVIESFLWYVLDKADTLDQEKEMFREAKKQVLESPAYIGEFKGRALTLKDFFMQVGLTGPELVEDSIQRAEHLSGLARALELPAEYQGIVQRYPVPEYEELFNNLIWLGTFFVQTEEENFPDIVLHFEHDDWFRPMSEEEKKEFIQENTVKAQEVPAAQPKESEEVVSTFKQNLRGMTKPGDWLHTDEAKASALAWAQKVGSPVEARKQLINSLEKAIPDIGQNFEAVESVMDLASHLKENGFEWEDLLYFDETTGQFSWQKE